MNIRRRNFLHLAAGAAALPVTSRIAEAQTYPSRPITMIAPVAPGSSGDVIARVIAERMKGALGQPIIIENVSGADGSIGVGRLARARPDGYTIDIGFLGAHVLNSAFYSLPYDLLNDFEPISLLTTSSFVIYARKSLPAKDLNELIAWLKANPDKASAAVTAAGQRIFAMLFQKETETHFGVSPIACGATLSDVARPRPTRAWRQSPTFRPLPRWDGQLFPGPPGSGFSHPGACPQEHIVKLQQPWA